jgi:hypothetical protein
VAIEAAWLQTVRRCRLYVYELPSSDFRLVDRSAGYWIARVPLVPIAVTEVVDFLAEIEKRGAELRICHALWPLHEVVLRSTLISPSSACATPSGEQTMAPAVSAKVPKQAAES